MAINLLPPSTALKGRDKILLIGLNKVVLVGFILVIAGALVAAGYFSYATVRLRSSLGSEEELRAQITSLSQTEQQFFLIKDRLGKARGVLGKESANAQIATLATLPIFAGEGQILEIQITSQKVTLGLVFPSSAAFGNFYKSLVESKTYKTVVLKSFSFNPVAGYIATFDLNNN